MQEHRNGRVLQFGAFELRTETGELRKHGTKIRLQGRPLQLLQALLERPGGMWTREELRDRLWAVDTFVDFESGLNTAVNRLRLALGESAEHPRYIETLARSGYRFIAPVSENDTPPVSENHMSPVSENHTPVSAPPTNHEPADGRRRSHGVWLIVVSTAILLVCAGLLFQVSQRPVPHPAFHQITFRQWTIDSARFGPDGESIIYEAREGPGDRELYMVNTVSPESRPLGFRRAGLASLSHSGELALISFAGAKPGGSLVRVPLNGGAPLPLDQAVCCADWSPDGSKMAVIRNGPRRSTLEYPRGKTLYQSSGWLSDIRVSPSGIEVAFMEHLIRGDDAGSIKLIDANGICRTLSTGWASAEGLAWAPHGREVWFTAAHSGVIRALYAVDLTSKLRLVACFPGTLMLLDISPSGRVLISREQTRAMMNGLLPGDPKVRDLSWFDYSHATDISDDGRVILFDETGEGGGLHHAVYVRRADAPSAVRVGDGWAQAISPDGNWVVTMPDGDQTSLVLSPLTPGQPRTISGGGLKYDWVRFFPDGTRLLVGGRLPGGMPRLFLQTVDGGKPAPLNTNVYMVHPAISADGRQIAGVDTEQRLVVLSLAGGEPKVITKGFAPTVLRWSGDGKSLLAQYGPIPAQLFRVDLETGRYKLWKEIAPVDLSGVSVIWPAVLSRDERTIAYSFRRDLSELFVVDGWR